LAKTELDAVADALTKSASHTVIFDMVSTKSEFRLDVSLAT